MTPDERYESAKAHRYCINCLATSHTTGACDSPDSCRQCGLAHHTLLHRPSHELAERAPHHSRRQVRFQLPKEPRKNHQKRTTEPEPKRKVMRSTSNERTRRNIKSPALQQRIRGLVDKARKTLQQLEDLVQVTSPQARRHVEDMSVDLIEF
ncbi:unnamed protein product [Ceratitis capitata]|uniref:(Mediterranean fruit fly) hypothetical protein n=1 Tax=Ceratitis capitata TaxID=7213 RepID=A0A811UQB2_CERCA|nr:unnamed protein product [Ceratitis capitata]